MDVHDKLDELVAVVEGARAMPLSGSCLIDRADVLGLLDDVRELLPQEVASARGLLADRERLVDEGRTEAQAVVDEAWAERARLVDESEVLAEASERADALLLAAREDADAMRREAQEWVDARLARVEELLARTLETVGRGRERLSEDLAVAAAADGHGTVDGEAADGETVVLPDARGAVG